MSRYVGCQSFQAKGLLFWTDAISKPNQPRFYGIMTTFHRQCWQNLGNYCIFKTKVKLFWRALAMLAFNLSKGMEFSCPACCYADSSSVAALIWVQLWLTCAAKNWSSLQFSPFLLLIWRRLFFFLCVVVGIFLFPFDSLSIPIKWRWWWRKWNFFPKRQLDGNEPRMKLSHLLGNHCGLFRVLFPVYRHLIQVVNI